jgi:hypothetical protein
MPPRFMTVSEASQQLVKILQNRAYQNDEYGMKLHDPFELNVYLNNFFSD